MWGVMMFQKLPDNKASAVDGFLTEWRLFLRSESGVVAVEWVALAAGVTVGAIAVSFIVMQGLVAPATHIASQLTP